MTFTERYVHTGNIALNVADWGVSSPGAPVVILIHGYGSSWHTWGRVVDKLSSMFHLYAVDLRGMGRSGRYGAGSDRQTWADDIASAIPRLSSGPVVLVGHSLGGWVTAAVASRNPHLVSKAVLVEAFSGAQSEVRKRERQVRHEERQKRAALIRAAITPADLVPMVSERYDGASANSISRIARMYFELDPALEAGRPGPSDDSDMFESMFRSIQCPALIIYGSVANGGIMSDEEARRVADLIPDSKLLSWPKVGHSPHIARNHDFIRALNRFASEQAPKVPTGRNSPNP
ncbi:MAG: alpha/beta hydrolase [Chloroflexi bacterium]|nr:alpha/beta hydrolase [Chloroflexota bacterium]